MKRTFIACLILSSLLGSYSVQALPPTAEEMTAASQWAAAKFDGIEPNVQPNELKVGIQVLQNHDPLQKNTRGGAPLEIGTVKYDHGLYAHAPSRLCVLLPKGAKRLTSQIGVYAHSGGGSIQFFVEANGKELCRSEMCRGGEEARDLTVDLNGTSEFFLCVSDGGDGIGCDQACWALATVELEDGTTLKLGDLDIQQAADEQCDFQVAYPFSFVYGGRASETFLKDWKKDVKTSPTADGKTLTVYTFTEPNGPLQVDCLVTRYDEFPMVEWTLKFRNLSAQDTPILENIQVIDTKFSRPPFAPKDDGVWSENRYDAHVFNEQSEFLLHHAKGAPYSRDDYHPYATNIGKGESRHIRPEGGRPTGVGFPYFNLQCGIGRGWIIVLGWSGQWAADIAHETETTMRVRAGQETTHFKLLANEEISAPTAVVMPWFRPSWEDAQNVWRAWMIRHNVPRVNGKVITHHLAACSSHWYAEMIQTDTAKQEMFIDRYLEEGLKLDYWWMDAGWYQCDGAWPKTGTWEVDTKRFPKGLREISDHAHSKGVKTIVWFEPERAHSGTWLTENHPDWCSNGVDGGLVNLGNPETLAWVIEHFNTLIKEQGVDLYRQDFNMLPLDGWRKRDTEDRQGITEIRHIEGYLKYWDSILKRNPGIRIDSCAGGGNRNDLQTLRRAVPLLRSDWLLEPISQQCHTYGISYWIPFHGTGQRGFNDYTLRSLLVPYLNCCHDLRQKGDDWEALRRNLKIWRKDLAPYYDGDYYPLTQYSLEDDAWMGWQFNSPEKNGGVIQMFRREASAFETGTFQLHGLDPNAMYEFRNVDTNETFTLSGSQLTQEGLKLTIPQKRSAAIWVYQKK